MTTQSRTWLAYGLRIRSVVALPGAIAVDADEAPEVEIVAQSTPVWTGGKVSGPYRAASADLFEFAMPGLARFTCVERRRIVIDAEPGADQAHIAEMVIATVLPALLWARGCVVLHAAAFVLPGGSQAVAVAGASGSGKSTALARALCLGASQVADDSLMVEQRHGGSWAAGLPGGYFERVGEGRVFRSAAADRRLACHRVGALLVLEPHSAGVRRLQGVEALEALLRHRHRPRIAALLGTEVDLLPQLSAVARSIPVVEMPRSVQKPLLRRDAASGRTTDDVATAG